MKEYIATGGVQSSGKTTFIFDLARQMKVAGMSTNVWTDIPRECPLPINEDNSSLTQWWIAAAMMRRTIELGSIYDYVLSDRTALDCVMYEVALRGWTPTALALMSATIEFLLTIPKTHILWVVKGWHTEGPKEETGRSGSIDFLRECEKASAMVLYHIQQSRRIPVTIIDLTDPPTFDQIIDPIDYSIDHLPDEPILKDPNILDPL